MRLRSEAGVGVGIAGALLLLGLVQGCGREAPVLVRRPAAPPSAVLIEDVAVLDVATGARTPDRDVLLEGDRIVAIVDAGEGRAPESALRIDGAGATLLPGLIDMHGHTGNGSAPSWAGALPDPERNLRAYLYCGVTTVLDPADLATAAFERREAIAAGELLGPRVFASGPMFTAPGGHPVAIMQSLAPWFLRWYLVPRLTRQVETPDAARSAVREVAGLGPDVVKLSVDRIPAEAPRIDRAVLAATVDEARKLGLRTVAHIGTLEDAFDAGDAGVSAFVHGVYKERIPDDQIARIAAYRIPMVATIGVFESYAALREGPRVPTPLERETVEPELLAAFDEVPDTEATRLFQPFIESLRPLRPAWRENVRRLRAAGVTILAGSDTQSGVFPGPGLHRELALLAEAGMTPAEAIRAATLDAARFLAASDEPEFGVVIEGRRADLLLVEGDPTQDLAALARIRRVIRAGVPLERIAIAAGATGG